MRDKLLALLLGGIVAVGVAGGVEGWMRSQEGGHMVVITDPPGMKYALAKGADHERRGWMEGAEPPR